MYVPTHFLAGSAAARDLIRREPFATLVSVRDDAPFVTHLPLLAEERHGKLVLTGHLARMNPHAELLDGAPVLAIFAGPHGYISPRWYTQRLQEVPTWNYVTVHCRGTAMLTNAGEKLQAVRWLVDTMESDATDPWSVDELDPTARDAMLKNIVAFTIHVDSPVAKFKLGQNKSVADRLGAVAGLRQSGAPSARALADAMEAATATQ